MKVTTLHETESLLRGDRSETLRDTARRSRGVTSISKIGGGAHVGEDDILT